ncbi:MAG: hypothetical protein IJ647_04210 [Prevotella sp.]|nr:hypothetical protein [Prevotella sp.]
MKEVKLTVQQKQYLVSELKDVVDNYEVYELDSPKDYGAVLTLLTGIFNEDWQTNLPETVINDYLVTYFKQELSA